MARKPEKKALVWAAIAAAMLAALTAAYLLARSGGVLGDNPKLALGIWLGAIAAVVYAFSARKWGLVILYQTRILRPREIAQDAATRARSEVEDLQREVDAGTLTAWSDVRAKAAEILARWNVANAFAVALEERAPAQGGAPAPPPGSRGPKITLVRREMFGKLEQWLYAHASLGAVAIFATLYHADFRLGGWVSGALTVCFLGAALTGIYGGWLYWVVPSRLAAAEGGLGYLETQRQIERVDEELAAARAKDASLASLLEAQRARLLRHFEPQRRYKRMLELWLVAHVPLAAAALGLLVVHVCSVVWY